MNAEMQRLWRELEDAGGKISQALGSVAYLRTLSDFPDRGRDALVHIECDLRGACEGIIKVEEALSRS